MVTMGLAAVLRREAGLFMPSKGGHQLGEVIAALFKIRVLVKAGGGGGQQHGFTRLRLWRRRGNAAASIVSTTS